MFGFNTSPVPPEIAHRVLAVGERIRDTQGMIAVLRTVASRVFVVNPSGVAEAKYTYR